MNTLEIIYEILKTLNRFNGYEDFDYEMISAKHLRITYNRWEQLMIMMQKEELIEGVKYEHRIDEYFPHFTAVIKPRITLKGIEYIESRQNDR